MSSLATIEVDEVLPNLPPLPAGGFCHAKAIRHSSITRWASDLKEPFRMHRKQWEFGLICETLDATGCLTEGKRGLGLGVGVEPLVSYFASRGCEILATDMSDGGWYETTLPRLNKRGLCPRGEFLNRVALRSVDMNWIPEDLRGFDFCWSCCSLDHLGSIRLSKRFVYNSLKCLKPGGIAVHTGEYNLTSDWKTTDYAHTVLWTRYDIEEVLAWLHERGHEGEFDWTVGDEPEDDILNQSDHCHLRLCIGEFVATSFGLVIRKGEKCGIDQ